MVFSFSNCSSRAILHGSSSSKISCSTYKSDKAGTDVKSGSGYTAGSNSRRTSRRDFRRKRRDLCRAWGRSGRWLHFRLVGQTTSSQNQQQHHDHFQRHKPYPTGRALHLPTAYARKPILYAVAPNQSHNNLPRCLMAKLLQLCLTRLFLSSVVSCNR